ncbi:MAG: AarF/UbiB family protein [Cyclobacteriaceae bacterium]
MSVLRNFKQFTYIVSLLRAMIRLRKSKTEQDKQIVRQKISEQLARNGGLAMKVGQVVANYKKDPAFTQLLKGIPQRKLSSMKSQFSKFPAHPCVEDFEWIDEKAHAASLGQVHRAKLKSTGEDVAIKIQYPEMEKTISAELKIAGLIPMMGPAKKWQIDLNSYKKVLNEDLKEELDYLSEAARQSRFHESLHVDGLVIPKVHQDMSSSVVLVQSWEEGVFFDEVTTWDVKDRMLVARTLMMTLMKSLFVFGEVHTDPHLGNFFFNKKEGQAPTVTLLDYGSADKISYSERMSLLKLILATREETPIDYMRCFAAMGFNLSKLAYIEHELPVLCPLLFKPFLTNSAFDIEAWDVTKAFEVILGERKWWFRSSGSADLYLIMRSFQGVMIQLVDLDVQLPCWGLLKKSVGEEVMQQARDFELPPMPEYTPVPKVNAISKRLKVIIFEGKKEIMDLTFPPDAALNIEELIPESVLNDLYKLGWDEEILKKQLISSHLAPQVIFDDKTNGRWHKVWLE